MKSKSLVVIFGLALSVAGGAAASPAFADTGFNATIAGQPNNSPLVNLAQSSTLKVDVVNLPANVGLYVLNCKVPDNPRSSPTLCDSSTAALAYLPADAAPRASVSIPIRVNAEFLGTNPNPSTVATPIGPVDCRVNTGNPRSTTCAVYVLGAGKESANPAYLRVYPTVFSPVSLTRASDSATVVVSDKVVKLKEQIKLKLDVVSPMKVSMKSGLVPNLTADNCAVTSSTIKALKDSGTCTVTISTTGGKNFRPTVTTRVFQLTR